MESNDMFPEQMDIVKEDGANRSSIIIGSNPELTAMETIPSTHPNEAANEEGSPEQTDQNTNERQLDKELLNLQSRNRPGRDEKLQPITNIRARLPSMKIGRASCRERV